MDQLAADAEIVGNSSQTVWRVTNFCTGSTLTARASANQYESVNNQGFGYKCISCIYSGSLYCIPKPFASAK